MKSLSPKVWLASLPWTTLTEPSLGLSILSAQLRSESIACRVWNLNLFILQFIKPTTYYSIANVYALNDFLFTRIFEEEVTSSQTRWLREKTLQLISIGFIDPREFGGVDGVMEQLLNLRNHIIPAWLADCAREINEANATMVGFSCMFDQTISSIALAKAIKQVNPTILTTLGGYAVRQPTAQAIIKSFDCIDAICLGEGEKVITPLAQASVGNLSLAEVPSIVYRNEKNELVATKPTSKIHMDDSPTPDFSDYYLDAEEMWQDHKIEVRVDRLPIETSRGCWWGAKHHCVFCGIHNEDMAYRSRTAENFMQVLDSLATTYDTNAFRFSDYILPYQFYKDLLPALAKRNKPYEISTEIKANVSPEK
ncbi:MAG: RiPP maturation radical SAM C-methyltransferase, partial [Bacteroidota bacterium]